MRFPDAPTYGRSAVRDAARVAPALTVTPPPDDGAAGFTVDAPFGIG